MEKEKNLHRVFTVVVVLVVGYFILSLIFANRAPEILQKSIVDSRTGLPLSQEEVRSISEQQAKEITTHTLSGEVTAKLRDSLQVEVSVQDKTVLLQLKFAPRTIITKNMPVPGSKIGSSATEEKLISLADVNVGDTVTVMFPQGLAVSGLGVSSVTVDNLTVDAPHSSDFNKD